MSGIGGSHVGQPLTPELEAEIRARAVEPASYTGAEEIACADVGEAFAEVDRLRDALRRYGQHEAGCPYADPMEDMPGVVGCSCALDEVFARAEAKEILGRGILTHEFADPSVWGAPFREVNPYEVECCRCGKSWKVER